MFFSVFGLALIGCSFAAFSGFTNDYDISHISLLYSEHNKGNLYHIYGKANYFMAYQVCHSNGMRLVRINDQSKSDDLTYFLEKIGAISGPFWTLANRLYDESTWAFAVGDPVKYFNWSPGEPNNAKGDEECVQTYRNGKWNDERCAIECFVLCESLSNS